MSQHGLLSSASSLTNLSSEPDFSLQRCRSASEIFEPNSGSVSRRLKTKQRAKDLRHSIADSRSDYYNNRRPQSISLSSQIPALSNLRSASSISALGTISENEALHGSSYTPFNSVRDSIYVEQPETPIFNYTTLLAESGTPLRRSSFRQQHTRPLSGEINPGPQIVGSGSHQLNGASPNAYANNSPATAPIHVSEPITQDFVPIYLNPLTGQMYSHNHDYFRPIFNPNELIARPPKPDRRLEESRTPQSSYIKFTQFLAILFFVCGNVFVLAACSLPALLCAHKVHQLNLQKKYGEAKKHSEYVLCFNVLGIVLHVVLVLAAIITAVVVAVVILG